MQPRVMICAESISPGNGGIARIPRLMARVCAEEMAAGNLQAQIETLSDPTPLQVDSLTSRTSGGSRLRYVWRVHRAALSCSHFLYDFLGMARAHCRLPFLRRPYLCWIAGVEIWEQARGVRLRRARQASMLMAITAFTRERADRLHGGFAHARVCWLGTADDEPAKPAPNNNGPPTVLILGRLAYGDQAGKKGHRELVDCWAKVVSAVPDARLLIVGGGSGLEQLKQRAAQSRASANILFKGFVPEQEIDSIWSSADVFAMPSRVEGFGLVYIEAMQRGLPVIASVHDAGQEINLDEETGYNVNLEKADDLPDRLIHLLKNPDHAAHLGENGRRRWQEHFSYSAFKARFLPHLREFLAS